MDDNIRGFPGYHITKEGKLYRYGKLLKVYHHHRYLRCKLHNGSISKNVKIHRLVAEAYIPNPENKPCVCHKDNNKSNDRVENLYWGTYKENSQQMVSDGRSTKGQHRPGIKQLKCFRNPRSILTKVRYQTLLKCIDDKTKIKALIKAWGISTRSMNRYVHKIKTGYYEA